MDVMVNQGLIASRSYSLWLDDLTDSSGTVLFGGYDTGKYTGELVLLPIQPDAQSGMIASMTVAWTSIAVTDNTGTTLIPSNSFPLPGVLDSGTTLMIVPSDVFGQLFNYFGVVSDQQNGNLVPCSIADNAGSLDFGFGDGPYVSVPFSELAVPALDNSSKSLTLKDGSPACLFGIEEAQQGDQFLLGDTFLRSAYVVYDLDAQVIGIAQTDFNSTKSNVVEISSSKSSGASSNPIASAVSIATGVTAAQTATAAGAGQIAPGEQTAGAAATGGGGIRPSSVGGLGQVTGVKTNLPVSTFPGATAHAGSGSKSKAHSTYVAPGRAMGLLMFCWTVFLMIGAGAVFSFFQ